MKAAQGVATALASRHTVRDVIALSRELAPHVDGVTRQDLMKVCSELDETSSSLTQLIKAGKV